MRGVLISGVSLERGFTVVFIPAFATGVGPGMKSHDMFRQNGIRLFIWFIQ